MEERDECHDLVNPVVRWDQLAESNFLASLVLQVVFNSVIQLCDYDIYVNMMFRKMNFNFRYVPHHPPVLDLEGLLKRGDEVIHADLSLSRLRCPRYKLVFLNFRQS